MNKLTLIKIAVVCFALVIGFVWMLPTLFGSATVRRWLFETVLVPQGIEAEIDEVRVGWASPTRVRGVSFGPTGKPTLLEAQEIQSDRTMLKAILEGVELGELTVVAPAIHIHLGPDSSNLEFEQPYNEQTPDITDDDDSLPSITTDDATKTLKLRIENAQLFIKTPSMPSESEVFSNVNLVGALQQDEEGRSLIVDGGRIVDHAKLSKELCAGGLKYIMPILSEATWTKGEFSIDLDACVIDLDDPNESLISGKLFVHGVEAGLNNQLIAAASNRVAALLGKDGFEAITFSDENIVQFQIRDGMVWHDGVEFGLPRVSEDLVVRTSGSVSLDESLDLTIDIPMPLHLIADGPIAQALTDKVLTLQAGGTLTDPKVEIADDDFVARLVGSIGQQLAEEERPVQSIVKGIRDVIGGGDSQESDSEEEFETPILDRIRDRMENRRGPLRRLFEGRQ